MTSFRDDPSVDYGNLVRRVPARVLAPATVDELVAAFAELTTARTPYKLRGSGHTASGEVLSDGGAVVSLAQLAGVVADDPAREEITARGGTTWLALWEHLALQGRRPLALTTNPRVTLAGTLAVGGVGESSHLWGPQVASVRRALLVTPDGARRQLDASDPLLAHALCGHGQLGALAEVTVATRRGATSIEGRVWRWGGLAELLADLGELQHDYVRARVVWNEGFVRAWTIIGDSRQLAGAGPADLPLPRHSITATPPEVADMLAHARVDPSARWTPYNPCVEIAVPFADGLATIRAVDRLILDSGLVSYLPRGSSLQLVTATPDLPVSPFRDGRSILFAIRPEPPTLEQALACEAPLRAIGDLALAAGGRVYLTSFALPPAALATQLGAAAKSLSSLKSQVDPHGLCNAGAFHGWISTTREE